MKCAGLLQHSVFNFVSYFAIAFWNTFYIIALKTWKAEIKKLCTYFFCHQNFVLNLHSRESKLSYTGIIISRSVFCINTLAPLPTPPFPHFSLPQLSLTPSPHYSLLQLPRTPFPHYSLAQLSRRLGNGVSIKSISQLSG